MGEKSTKYFYTRYKSRNSHSALAEIQIPTSQTQNNNKEVLNYIKEQYTLIYSKEEINQRVAEQITNNLPQATSQMNNKLVGYISREEIIETIKKLPNNKSPGLDGLTYEFYKLTEEHIVPALELIFNQVLDTGIMPPSWCKNLIILIPKKSKDLYDINNWRPISLVNCDAKIFMKIIANRLNTICEKIVPQHQQGFIAKRLITDSALDILTILRNQEDESKNHWMLFVDQQKAFDRISHEFLQIVLKNMNFNKKFRELVGNLFNRQEAHITDAGHISSSFRVERGVRQGDPLSPLLYVLAFEPLLNLIDREIAGIKINNHSFKCTAYADDLTIGIGSLSDWTTVLNLLEKYEEASNSRINKQ